MYEFRIWVFVTFLVGLFFVFLSRYNALDGMVKSTGTARVVKKMLIDQFVFVPCCQILFFTGNSILENPSAQPEAALEKLRGCLPTSLAVFGCVPLVF